MTHRRWSLVGVVLLVVGVVMVLTAPGAGASDFGWFAYTPLTDHPGPPDIGWLGHAVVTTRAQLVGAAVVVAGLLVVVTALAYRAGRRGARA